MADRRGWVGIAAFGFACIRESHDVCGGGGIGTSGRRAMDGELCHFATRVRSSVEILGYIWEGRIINTYPMPDFMLIKLLNSGNDLT